MKIYILFILLISTVISIPIEAQVKIGVKTLQPQAAWHIDPKGDTSGTSLSTDDIVLESTSGNLGIGTLAPTSKLDIAQTLRVRKGDPLAGKVLTSVNMNGDVLWRFATSPKDTHLNRILPSSIFTYSAKVESTIDQFTILTPGNYIAIFRWWGVIDDPSVFKNVYLMLYINGNQVDKIEHYMTTNDSRGITCFSTCLFAMNVPANATIKITAQFENSSHTIGKYPGDFTKPSIVFFGI